MSTIPASAIVSVIPNVLAAGGSALDLSGLLLTTNARVPIGAVASFPTAKAVSDYFGASSIEYALATTYFNGFKNSNVKPGAVLFAQYPTADVAAFVRGGNVSSMTLAQLQALNAAFSVTIDGVVKAATINLTGATSFSNAALLIADALAIDGAQAAAFTGSIAGTVLTVSAVASGALAVGQVIFGVGVTAMTYITSLGTGTGGVGTYNLSDSQTVASESMTADAPAVEYDSVSGAFIIRSGTAGAPGSTIGFGSGALATSLKLTEATGAVISQGADASVPAAFMDAIVAQNQNWATFMTCFDPDGGSGHTVKLAFANWVSDQNNRYAYACSDSDESPTTTLPATASLGYAISQAEIAGVILVYDPEGFNLAAFACGAVASIDFTQLNGRTTIAFRAQDGIVATVTDPTVAENLIGNGYNFYGAYGTANDEFVFFYPGSISGDFLWVDSYVNQIWLNNAFQLALMVLLTQVKSIAYNRAGYAMIEAALADPINAGLNFGAFRAGVTLSESQKAQVNAAAGVRIDDVLQNQGWYVQVKDASPEVRQARASPPCSFWYMDGQSVQKINLASIALQ